MTPSLIQELISCIERAIAEGEGALMDNYLAHELDKAGLEVVERRLPDALTRTLPPGPEGRAG